MLAVAWNSIYSNGFDLNTNAMEDPIRVVCRVRPPSTKESSLLLKKAVLIEGSNTELIIDSKPEQKVFTFDYVADERIHQEEFFQRVGLPITEACLQGFYIYF